MLIGVDGNEANVKNRVGVNVYTFELLSAMASLLQKEGLKHHLIVYLKNPPLSDLPKPSKFLSYRVLPGGNLWILTRLMPDLFFNKVKPDIFFTPSHYVPPFAPTPRVCSIMDLGYLKSSEQFKKITFWQLKYWSAISILVSKAVIAISNSTKDDIVRHYPFAAHRVSVTPLAYDKNKFNLQISPDDVRRITNKYHIVGDYILFLSTLKPSKNIEGLIEAFSLIKGVKLVIAGKKGWLYESIFRKVKGLGLENKVIFTDFVPEEDKPGLIKGAKVFVLPSFWEGFGLDLLNAMAAGVAVVASNVGSIPEVVGDAGILVDPKSPDGIAKGLKKVLSMPENEYNKLVEKGLTRVKQFSWEKTARETLKILERTV
jgi:glycosyltransferase involved in cell wall biosynthesis